MFPLENINTELLMGNPVNKMDLGDLGKGRFTVKKRLKIDELQPRQNQVSGGTLNYKLTGKGFTVPYVAVTESGNILIDGHHTVIAKKLKGQRFVFALCYFFK